MYCTRVQDLDIQIVQRILYLENNSRVSRINKWHLHYFIHQKKKKKKQDYGSFEFFVCVCVCRMHFFFLINVESRAAHRHEKLIFSRTSSTQH